MSKAVAMFSTAWAEGAGEAGLGGGGAVGDVKHSNLTEVQIQAELDDTWVLADGRDVTGSAFHTLTGLTILPDCRGQFIRGKNNGRADGKENPQGDLALGTYEADESNRVDYRFWQYNVYPGASSVSIPGDGTYSGWGTSGNNYTHNNGDGVKFKTNAAETRPKSATMNVFIKIN